MKQLMMLLSIGILLMCGCSREDKIRITFIRQGIIKDIQYQQKSALLVSYTKTVLIFTDGTRLILTGEHTPPTGKLIDIYWLEIYRYWNKGKFPGNIEFIEGNYDFVPALKERPEGSGQEDVIYYGR